MLARFIKDNYEFFIDYDVVKVYYDNGQVEITKLLFSVFNALLDNVEFRRVYPSDYRLFQVADLVCSMKLIKIKLEHHELSAAEKLFFKDTRSIQKNYLKRIEDKTLFIFRLRCIWCSSSIKTNGFHMRICKNEQVKHKSYYNIVKPSKEACRLWQPSLTDITEDEKYSSLFDDFGTIPTPMK